MKYRATIGPKASHVGKHGAVSITSRPLAIDLDPVKLATDAAQAGAAAIAADIAALPGDQWDKTGALKRGIAARQTRGGAEVTAPPDRLTRDPVLLEKLTARLAVLRDPTNDKRIEKAIEKSAADIVKVGR